MSTICMNTLNGAVTEFDWNFQSITPTHAGDVTGLYALGGDTDAGRPIDASFMTPLLQWQSSLRKAMSAVYFSMSGAGVGNLHVHGKVGQWAYPFAVRASEVSRASPGRGICESYLAFGFSNKEGAAFSIDAVEVATVASNNRRI